MLAAVTAAANNPGSFPLDSLPILLPALRALGGTLDAQLLQSVADRAAAAVDSLLPAALVDLLGVFAGLKFHPGTDSLHNAALRLQTVSSTMLVVERMEYAGAGAGHNSAN